MDMTFDTAAGGLENRISVNIIGKSAPWGPRGGSGGGPKCSLFITKVPQGVDQPRPMPNAMGRRPIADGVRATRGTHATTVIGNTPLHPQKRTPTPHTFGPLSLSSSRSFLESDESADGQPSTQHEIHKAHQTARVCIQALRVVYFTLSSPGFAPCGANASTSPPSCTSR